MVAGVCECACECVSSNVAYSTPILSSESEQRRREEVGGGPKVG